MVFDISYRKECGSSSDSGRLGGSFACLEVIAESQSDLQDKNWGIAIKSRAIFNMSWFVVSCIDMEMLFQKWIILIVIFVQTLWRLFEGWYRDICWHFREYSLTLIISWVSILIRILIVPSITVVFRFKQDFTLPKIKNSLNDVWFIQDFRFK